MNRTQKSVVAVLVLVGLIVGNGWSQEKTNSHDMRSKQLRFTADSGNFRLQIIEDDSQRQLAIPPAWLIPDEDQEEDYVSSTNYDDTLTVFRIGSGLTGIQLSSYDIQKEGSAQAAAGRDVFLVYDYMANQVFPGLINLGITKERVRSGGTFYASNHLFLLADINHDGFKDIGIIKEDLEFSSAVHIYNRHPTAWYLFDKNRWIHEADSSGLLPAWGIRKLPLIGLGKSPVDFIKETYLSKYIRLLDYTDFGLQAMAYQLIGYQWYQWNSHGDSIPGATYDIKIVVYQTIPLDKVKELYPVIKELKQDYRYVTYRRALKYLDRQLLEIEDIKQSSEQADQEMYDNIKQRLSKTREEIVTKLAD
jgi:hypothetical protein